MKPLDRKRHRALRLSHNQSYQFVSSRLLVTLVAAEVAHAAREYPVVFPVGDDPMPMALLGVKAGENLHVNGQGQWLGRYIPAVIRSYPFQLMMSEAEGSGVDSTVRAGILIDESAPHLSDQTGEPLFTETGDPSPVLLRVQKVLVALEQDRRRTVDLVSKLIGAGLLVERDLTVRPAGDAGAYQITGVRVVDKSRLKQLPSTELQDLMQSGALDLLYAHLLSLTNLKDGWMAKQLAITATAENPDVMSDILGSDTISFDFL
ncbi:SapC family protein [Thiorhodococcus drewsii AZ1]|uniref:SapC family protein n=2 Tax=Thiorhodococcus drewsii TaxID=210408 RepID=G2E5V4_9GAMM|nr:SapC family protein [Thiorhodococcus drewsii AZ1]